MDDFWLRWLLRLILFPLCAVLMQPYFFELLIKTAARAVKPIGQRR